MLNLLTRQLELFHPCTSLMHPLLHLLRLNLAKPHPAVMVQCALLCFCSACSDRRAPCLCWLGLVRPDFTFFRPSAIAGLTLPVHVVRSEPSASTIAPPPAPFSMWDTSALPHHHFQHPIHSPHPTCPVLQFSSKHRVYLPSCQISFHTA